MPLAGDPTLLGQIPISHDPLQRVSFQAFKTEFDLEAFLEQTRKFIEDIFFDLILDMTGIDLRSITNIVESIFTEIVNSILSVFGLDLNTLGALNPTLLLQQLLSFIPGLGGGTFDLEDIATDFINNILNPTGLLASITEFVESILGTGGTLPDVTTFFTNIRQFLSFDFTNPAFDLGDAVPEFINNIIRPFVQLLFSGALPEWLPLISLGSIRDISPNFLLNPNFDGPNSIAANSIWVPDAAVGRTAVGAARTTADGTLKALVSNVVPAAPGQVLDIAAYVKWSGLVSTGSPLAVGVKTFLNGDDIATTNLASVTSPGAAGGWNLLSGSYTVPASGVDAVAVRLTVAATATAGTVWFDDAELRKNGLLEQNWISGLVDQFQGVLDLLGLGALGDLIDVDVDTIWTDVIENIFGPLNLLTSGTDFVALLTQILDKLGNVAFGDVPSNDLFDIIGTTLSNIPFLNIIGIGGPPDIGASIQQTWDQLIGGLVGAIGSGSGLSDLFNIAQDISSRASLGLFSFDILGIRNNNPLNSGFLPSGKSNISLDQLVLTPGTVAITQSTALTAYSVIKESIDIGAISWNGSGVTSITDAYVNIYKMNSVTGQNSGALHASTNQIGILSAAMQQNIYSLPGAPVHFEPGEILGVEIAIRGAGTHSVLGAVSTLVDQAVFPRRWSSVRNSGTSAAPTAIWTPTYSNNVPFIEHAVSAGFVDMPHTPQIFLFNTPGTTNMPIPSWADVVERIAVGGAGGGRRGGTWNFTGEGGDNGVWATDTLVRGTDFTGSPSISITVGAGGVGGSPSQGDTGGAGGSSVASIPGHTLTAPGGNGGDVLEFGGANKEGDSPGNQVYGGVTYVGGGAQYAFGAPGASPGGGGAGGSDFLLQNGGDGAPGAVWIRFRQN